MEPGVLITFTRERSQAHTLQVRYESYDFRAVMFEMRPTIVVHVTVFIAILRFDRIVVVSGHHWSLFGSSASQ